MDIRFISLQLISGITFYKLILFRNFKNFKIKHICTTTSFNVRLIENNDGGLFS